MAELLLPALGPDGPGGGHGTRVQQLCEYLLRDYVRSRQLRAMQVSPGVYDGLQMLERAGLVSTISVQRSPLYKITPLGDEVLADGTLRKHIMPGV
jgi:DNA-binding PadR family transcriptional regulator